MDLHAVLEFARRAHGDQKRKYSGAPYIEHPMEVSLLVLSVLDDDEAVAAAILHDVVEDTAVTLAEIEAAFGARVARIVSEVTDVSRPCDGNRANRKAMDRAHIAAASPEGKTVKLADLISNTSSIMAYDRDFAKVYIPEKRRLLDVLTEGHPVLYLRACMAVERAEVDLAS